MNALDTLFTVQEIRREILRRQEHADTLRRLAERITPLLRDVQVRSSPDPARLQSLLAGAADEDAEILRLRQKLADFLPDCALAIAGLPDRRLALLMEMRYLEGLSFPEIGAALCHSRSYIHKLHQQALLLLGNSPDS